MHTKIKYPDSNLPTKCPDFTQKLLQCIENGHLAEKISPENYGIIISRKVCELGTQKTSNKKIIGVLKFAIF